MSKLIKIRVLADSKKIDHVVTNMIENCESMGLKFIEKSKKYLCRYPNSNDCRIYLTFEEL